MNEITNERLEKQLIVTCHLDFGRETLMAQYFPIWFDLSWCLKWSTKRAVSARLAGIYQEIDWMACQCKFVFTLISRTRPVILHESSIGNEMPTKAGNSSLLIAQLSSTAPLHEPTARSITFHENWSIYRNSRHWTIKCYKWRCRVPF